MTFDRRQAIRAFRRLAEHLDTDVPADVTAQDGYRVPDLPDSTELAAEATGTVSFDVAASQTLSASQDINGLGGIVWGAGDHNLSLGGQPTPVRVPPETIQPTFEAMKEGIADGDVTLGFDHPGPDSVAARTGIVDIGEPNDIALSADEQYIVMTDSTLTNDRAAEAAERGDFDDLDWSVVADVAVRRDANGDPVVEDGRVLIDATRIRRVDAVDTGAVDASSIERSSDALPDLRDEARVVEDVAAGLNQPTQAVTALQASATAINQHMGNNFDPNVGDDLPDSVRTQLNAAAEIIDDQEEQLQAAQARADGFDDLLQAHGLDEDDFESPAEAAQALIDEQTESTRQEIAELEAELGAYDVDDAEARAADLAGQSPDELQNTLNARKADAFDRQQKAQQKGRAAARDDVTGRANFAGGDGAGGSADADEIALSAMDGTDRIQAEANGESPAEYVQSEYGLSASQYDAADELHSDIMDAIGGDN